MSTKFTLDPSGPVKLVSAKDDTGATLTVYSDSATTTSVTLPAEVAASTDFYLKSTTASGHWADVVVHQGDGTALPAVRVPLVDGSAVAWSPDPSFVQIAAEEIASSGTATLAAGAATVTDALITANSVIRLSYKTIGGTPGAVYVSAKTAGTSFVITSTSNLDASVIYYEVLTY